LAASCELVVEGFLVEVPLEGARVDDVAVELVGCEVEVLGDRDGQAVVRDSDDGAHGTAVMGGDRDPGGASVGEGGGCGEGDGGGAVSSPDADELDGLHGVLLVRVEVGGQG